MNEEKLENLAVVIDEIDSLCQSLSVTFLDDRLHVEGMRSALPEKVSKLKESYIEISGQNPWE